MYRKLEISKIAYSTVILDTGVAVIRVEFFVHEIILLLHFARTREIARSG